MAKCSEWHTCAECEHCATEADRFGKYACEGFGDGRTTEPGEEACGSIELINPEECFFVHTRVFIKQQMEQGDVSAEVAESLTAEVMVALREELKSNADAVRAFLES